MKEALKKTLRTIGVGIERRLILLGIVFVVVLVFPLAIVRWIGAIVTNPEKGWNISKAFDRVGNVLTNGDWREMISTRAHRAWQEGKLWGCILCKILNEVDPNHCQDSKE